MEEGGIADQGDGGRSCKFGAGAKGRGRERRTGLISCDLHGKDPGSRWGEYVVTVSRAERSRSQAPLRRWAQLSAGDLSLRSRCVDLGAGSMGSVRPCFSVRGEITHFGLSTAGAAGRWNHMIPYIELLTLVIDRTERSAKIREGSQRTSNAFRIFSGQLRGPSWINCALGQI